MLMDVSRRNFLLFLGTFAGTLALGQKKYSLPAIASTVSSSLPFTPVDYPLPLAYKKLQQKDLVARYSNFEVKDDLVLPQGYQYQVIAAWGDKVGDSRFGYNNDYLSFVETSPNEGYLTINFEYISGYAWMQNYASVIGKELSFAEAMNETNEDDEIDAFGLNNEELKVQLQEIARESLTDLGIGVISVRRLSNGKWQRTYSKSDRRITGISGLDDSKRLLKSTGAATRIFKKKNKIGYEDKLGERIVGTFQNCAGGTTPWGTVLSAEENYQAQVPEAVMADGSSFSPSATPFVISGGEISGNGNVFGLAGNKYGWLVEIDPVNENDYGTKHTWLGRYRHEAFGIRAEAGKPLAVYSGCDRRGGHIYKFVSKGKIANPKDRNNSRLFAQGMLYGAKFYQDGTGEWIALRPDTPINPVKPSEVRGGMVKLPNPDRQAGGVIEISSDFSVELYRKQFKTLGDLYVGELTDKQGAILIDAHFAATAAGITCTARPEDTIVREDGTLFIAFTSGSPGSDGGSDKMMFASSQSETEYEHGGIFKLEENNGDPAAMSFRWSSIATGGEPAKGGMGFANPDNIEIDGNGDLWIVTDMSTSKHNREVLSRSEDGETLSDRELTGIFGNNSLWYLPLSGENAGTAYPFAIGPVECECTGIFFTPDSSTLFLSVQHPGEYNGTRQGMATETRFFELLSDEGEPFSQKRQVPVGSNWPSKQPNQPPLPGIVAIYKSNGKEIIPRIS